MLEQICFSRVQSGGISLSIKKLSVALVVIAMVSIGFGNIISDNVQAAFVVNLSSKSD